MWAGRPWCRGLSPIRRARAYALLPCALAVLTFLDPASSPAAIAEPTQVTAVPSEARPLPHPGWQGPPASDVFTLGDSVMLGAQPCLERLGYTVDAQGSRSARAGIARLSQGAVAGDLPPWVVVHLGTNGGVTWRDIADILELLGPARQVVLGTIQLPDDPTRFTFETSSNLALHAAALRHANVRIADWHALSERYDGMVWPEGIHLTPLGCWAYAELVRSAMQRPSRAPLPSDVWPRSLR